MLLDLAWRNIWRNRNRTIITVASIACAVLLSVITVALQKGVFDNLIRNVVGLYTGHIQIHARGYWEEQILDNSIAWSDSLTGIINGVADVQASAPRMEAYSLISGGEKTKGGLVIGILPTEENRLTHLQDKIVGGDFLTGPEELLVSAGLAAKLKVKVGDTLVLLTQGYFGSTAAGKYPVGGLLHFASPDLNSQLVYLPLSAAQRWLDAPGRITTLAVTISDEDKLNTVAQSIQARLPEAEYEVITWEKMMPEIEQHIKTDTAGNYIFLAVLYLLISFGIFSTLLMMLAERQREFGMLVALGMQPFNIARVLLYESVMLTFMGCLAGIALSLPLTYWLTVQPIRLGGELGEIYERFGFEPVIPATMDASIFIHQSIVVLSIGVVLALYPVFKVMKLDPTRAMRR